MADASVQATTAPALGRKLLRGGADIANAILGASDEKAIRWLYGQLPNLGGVVWRLTEGGELYAFEDALLAHFEEKAAEAKAAASAARAAKAAEKEALLEAARKAAGATGSAKRRSSVAAE
jgi:hypothetical protein